MDILITGASRGIGFELAHLFANDASNTLFLISRNKQKLDDLMHSCKKAQAYAKLIALPFDLANIIDIKNLAAQIAGETKKIDIVINNAGYLVNKPFEAIQPNEVEEMYKVNVMAPIELIRCLLPQLKNSQGAHVINISSMGGFQGSVKFPGLAGYASSKAAIACLTECLAEEYKDSPLKFNCLALGAVSTEMLAEAFPGYAAPTSAKEMARFIYDFSLTGHTMFNGKILPVSLSTP
jgi:short-subunit dehydrogenase